MAEQQQSAAAASTQTVEQDSLLDQIVEQGRMTTTKERGKDLVKEFVTQVLDKNMQISADAEAMINQRIADIDRMLSAQLNEILHHAEFQKLEGSWRGLRYLMDQTETGVQCKIKVLNVNKRDLLRDLKKAPEFDQSALFKQVYEEEFGQFGGAPFGALVGNYEFGRGPEDMELLEKVAQVASAAHAPFLSAADPGFLNLESFS